MGEFAGIAETYDWTEQSTDDLPFYVGLARESLPPILEIGAGTGRVTIPVARLGKSVTALDISANMLARARAKWQAQGDGKGISFVIGDFRALALRQSFGLILAPGRVFEHAISNSDREAAFCGCAAHLSTAGLLVLHVWGPPADLDPSPPEKSSTIPPTGEHGALRFSWREERDFEKELRRHCFRIEEMDGQQKTWQHDPIEIRWYTREALDRLGDAAGLVIQNRFRDFKRNPYEPGSLNMIWVYEKK